LDNKAKERGDKSSNDSPPGGKWNDRVIEFLKFIRTLITNSFLYSQRLQSLSSNPITIVEVIIGH